MSQAQKLCAMLITRSLKELDDDEEEIVVDYLESMGVSVTLDMSPKDMCVALMEKTMEQELNRRVPMTAYANSILNKDKLAAEQKRIQEKEKNIRNKRTVVRKQLENKADELPGCIVSDFLSNKPFLLVTKSDIGIVQSQDGRQQYSAVVTIPQKLYENIFENFGTPVLEFSANGRKAFARISAPHQGNENAIYVSPLISTLLDFTGTKGKAIVNLCLTLPIIAKVDFAYYGTADELKVIQEQLLNQLPFVINAFSYLSLGMILVTTVGDQEVEVRVDGLLDENDKPIFAGLIAFSENDLPIEIYSDI